MIAVSFTLNGAPATVEIDPADRLLDLLRDRLGLTGTKEGCGEGECGACTVWLDGLPVNSCLVPAYQARGSPPPGGPAVSAQRTGSLRTHQ